MTREIPPRHAVVGIDSAASRSLVVPAALDLHARFGTRLEFIHAVDLPKLEMVYGRPDRMSKMEAAIEGAAFERLSEHLQELTRQAGSDYDTREHLLVTRGSAAQVLTRRAELDHSDLLILGPHEKRGLFDFGSTTRALLAKAPCDLWIQPCASTDMRQILVPVDLSEESSLALQTARTLALHCAASVTVLHCFLTPDVAYAASPGYPIAGPTYVIDDVRDDSREEFERTLNAFDWQGVEHDARFVEARPVDGILELQSDHDLIVMGTHGRTGLSAALLGNVAYSVFKSAEIPVLAIRQPQRDMLLES